MVALPNVLILSKDALLRELLDSLLRHEHYGVLAAGDLRSAAGLATEHRPNVAVIDAIDNSELAEGLLLDPEGALGEAAPAFVLLGGSATPADVLESAVLDRVLMAPLSAAHVMEALRYHSGLRPRRLRGSGVHMRATLHETTGQLKVSGVD